MRPEAIELLLATFAESRNPSQVEAFLRLQMDQLRGRGEEADRSVRPRLELDPGVRRRAEDRLRQAVARAESMNGFLITPWDESYPRRLRAITGPPPVLYCIGNGLSLLERSVALVGSLTPSRWGVETAIAIAGHLSRREWTIVSGLAVGIDRRVHQETIRCGGRTVAVLPGALDQVSPAAHRDLAGEILESGGLLVSELPFGTQPNPATRIRRDRIQSGICLATILVESELEGGAMHTARFALAQGRSLYASVPRDSSRFQSRGALKLLYEDRVAMPLEVPEGLTAFERDLASCLRREGKAGRGPFSDSPQP